MTVSVKLSGTSTNKKSIGRRRRHLRVRKKVEGTPERPRLVVYRSLKHVYAQLVDDRARRTIVTVADFRQVHYSRSDALGTVGCGRWSSAPTLVLRGRSAVVRWRGDSVRRRRIGRCWCWKGSSNIAPVAMPRSSRTMDFSRCFR